MFAGAVDGSEEEELEEEEEEEGDLPVFSRGGTAGICEHSY